MEPVATSPKPDKIDFFIAGGIVIGIATIVALEGRRSPQDHKRKTEGDYTEGAPTENLCNVGYRA